MEASNLTEQMQDEAFTDPVLRCDSCVQLVRRSDLHKLGKCPKCGNKRVRALDIFSEEEHAQIMEWGFTDFLKEFGQIDD